MSDELVKWHEAQANYAMNNLSCGSDNYEYRQAHREADFHRSAAARIRLLEQQLKTAREEERERCAKLAEKMSQAIAFYTINDLAAAIRSLGESGAHPPGE